MLDGYIDVSEKSLVLLRAQKATAAHNFIIVDVG